MASKKGWKNPAGINDDFCIDIMILEKNTIKGNGMRAEKGPKVDRESIILSSQLKEGVTIPASSERGTKRKEEEASK